MRRGIFAMITGEANWLPRYGEGRVCAHEGCGTVLNPYNKTAHCGLHEPEPDWYNREGECFAECPDCGSFRKVAKPKRGVSLCRTCLRRRAREGAAA